MRRGRLIVLAVFVVLAGCGGDVLPVSTTTDPLVTVTTAATDFGHVGVGGSSSALSSTVKPAAHNAYDTVQAVTAGCADFTINAANLPAIVYWDWECTTCVAGGSDGVVCPVTAKSGAICSTYEYDTYTFDVTFHPSVPGPQSCVVTVHVDNDTDDQTITFTGTGDPPPIAIDVQPAGGIQFGQVRATDQSGPATVTVRNAGSGTLTVSSAAVSGGYAMSGPTAFSLGGGASQALTLRCTPPGVGDDSGSLTIDSNDSAHGHIVVPLGCTGVESAFDVNPSPIALETRVGDSTSAAITLSNPTQAALTFTSIAVAGDGLSLASDYSGLVLGPGVSQQLEIAYGPTTAGPVAGTLTVATDQESRTAAINAMATTATLSVAPDGAVDFGPVCAGGVASATQTFTVLDLGDGGFQIQGVSGLDATPFAITANGGDPNGQLQPSGANDVTLDITATPATEGVATAELAIATDIPGGAPHTIELSVTGLPAGTSASPAMLDLGSAPLATTTLGAKATVANCSADAVAIAGATIGGADADSFTIVEPPAGNSIDPLGTASWLVVMTAQTAGPKSAELDVSVGGQTIVVPLVGEGVDPTAQGGGDEHSYYTCNAGGGGAFGAWAIGLALLVRRKNRRRA